MLIASVLLATAAIAAQTAVPGDALVPLTVISHDETKALTAPKRLDGHWNNG